MINPIASAFVLVGSLPVREDVDLDVFFSVVLRDRWRKTTL